MPERSGRDSGISRIGFLNRSCMRFGAEPAIGTQPMSRRVQWSVPPVRRVPLAGRGRSGGSATLRGTLLGRGVARALGGILGRRPGRLRALVARLEGPGGGLAGVRYTRTPAARRGARCIRGHARAPTAWRAPIGASPRCWIAKRPRSRDSASSPRPGAGTGRPNTCARRPTGIGRVLPRGTGCAARHSRDRPPDARAWRTPSSTLS